jgi:hypothetical protein
MALYWDKRRQESDGLSGLIAETKTQVLTLVGTRSLSLSSFSLRIRYSRTKADRK